MMSEILSCVIAPLLVILTKYLVELINSKVDEIKANKKIRDNAIAKDTINDIEGTIIRCINKTSQTFVKRMKATNNWNDQTKKEALELTKAEIIEILTEEKVTLINEMYTNLNIYLETVIEDYLNKQ